MLKRIDGWDIAAQVRLMRQAHKGSFLILEGATDDKAISRYINEKACQIVIAFGKDNVIQALDLLEEDGFPGVAGLVDADFDRILGASHSLENLHVTGAHDLDLTIFASNAFDHYVNEYCDKSSMHKSYRGNMSKLREFILSSVVPISICRLISCRDRLDIYFKNIEHKEFIDADTLTIEINHLLDYLIRRSSHPRCSLVELTSRFDSEMKQKYDLYQLVSGHDAAAGLGIALRKLLGSRRDQQTWGSEVEAGLRLAFSREAFEDTEIYKWLKSWETNNSPYRIVS